MTIEISFDVEVSRIDTTYGLVLSLHEDEVDEGACYFLVFEGPTGQDPVDVAKLFGASLTLVRPDQHVAWRGDRWRNAFPMAVGVAAASPA